MRKKEYPYNLLDDIATCKGEAEWQYPPLPDFDKSLEAALSQLNASEQAVIKGYYKEHRTLAAVGAEMGVSGSYIGTVRRQAIRKLCRPVLLRYLTDGLAAVNKEKAECEAIEAGTFESGGEHRYIYVFDVAMERTSDGQPTCAIHTSAYNIEKETSHRVYFRGAPLKWIDKDNLERFSALFPYMSLSDDPAPYAEAALARYEKKMEMLRKAISDTEAGMNACKKCLNMNG